MVLRLVGTGFGRTGTESMRMALNRLGFGPTHHMGEVMADVAQRDAWRRVYAGATPDWDALFAGYHACVDWPSAAYWPQIAAHYPDARVLLTLRSPESWWASFEKTILQVYLRNTDPASMMAYLPGFFGGDPADPEVAKAAFRRNTQAVLAAFPPERLLVYELGSGWGPLCDFLGVPVPEEPYPSTNNADDFHAAIATRNAQSPSQPR